MDDTENELTECEYCGAYTEDGNALCDDCLYEGDDDSDDDDYE